MNTRTNPIQAVQNFGQSIWCDHIRRAMLDSGDRQALLDNCRRVLRIHLGKDVEAGLRTLVEALA